MIKLRAVLEMFTNGTDKAKKETQQINDQLDQAADNAARMNRTLSQTRTGRGAMERAGVTDTQNYRTQRGVTGSRGAEGRNFAGLAQGGGGQGFVAAYATLAANLFAVTAAFQALSNAAKVSQLNKGMEILGATSGVTLKNVSRGLQEVTGFGISAADSMRSVALASSAGLSQKEIENLGKIAKGASIALGRDLSDSMDRLIKGTVKLEPELLDELGIMVRLDDAVNAYALANNKTASSLTQLERRQAFANAVASEGIQKFGELATSANVSPYDRLSAGVRELGTDILSTVNSAITPFVELVARAPVLAIIPFTGLLQAVSGKVLPTFDSSMAKSGAQMDKYSSKFDLISERNEELQSSILSTNKGLMKAGAIYSKSSSTLSKTVIGPGLVSPELSGISDKQLIKAIDKEILAIRKKILPLDMGSNKALSAQIDNLKLTRLSLKTIAREQKEILRIQNQQIAVGAVVNAQASQRGILEEFNSNILSKGLISATFTGIGDIFTDIVVPGFKEANKTSKTLGGSLVGLGAKFRVAGVAAVTAGRLIGIAFLNAIPIIGQLIMVGSLIAGAFALFESEASKQEKKLLENLKNINQNAKEVEKQIDKAFGSRNYGVGFEAAITSLSEIIAALKDIINLREGAFGDPTSTIVSKDFVSSSKRALSSLLDFRSYKLSEGFQGIGTIIFTRTMKESSKGLVKSKEEADALMNSLGRIANIRGPEYARGVYEKLLEAGENYLPVLEREDNSVKAIASSWSAVGEEAINTSKTLKKLYGKPITETDYTPVVSSLINIQRETNAITEAFEAAGTDSTLALTGLYDNLAKGGTEVFAELDRLAKNSSYSFLKTFSDIKALDTKIGAMQTAGAPEADIQAQIDKRNKLAASLAEKAASTEYSIRAKIKDNEILILDRKKAILDLTKKQNELEKNIAQKALSIAKSNRDIQRLRSLGTTEVSSGLTLQDELNNAKEKAKIESVGLRVRGELIALEFELEKLKLANSQKTLESGANKISAFVGREDLSSTGTEIAKSIIEGLGDNASFSDFRNALKANKFYSSSIGTSQATEELGFTEEQINSLWDYAAGLEYTNKSTTALSRVAELQTVLMALETESNKTATDAIQEKIKAYNHEFNIRQRAINQSKLAIAQEEKILGIQRSVQDLNTDTDRLAEDAMTLASGREVSARTIADRQIQDQNSALERLKEDRITLAKKAFQENKELTLAVDKLLEQYITAKLDPDTEQGVLQQLEDSIRSADIVRANAADASAEKLALLDAQAENAEGALAKLASSVPDLMSVIRSAKNAANDNLNISQAGIGMSLLGAGGTFRTLVEQAGAKDPGGVQAVLADESQMQIIKQTAKEIEFMNIQAEGLNTVFAGVRDSIANAFVAIIDGSKSAGQAFGEMAQQILRDIAAMIIKMLVFKAIEAGLNMIPGIGPGLAAGFRAITGAAGGIIPLASGGVMDRSMGLQGVVKEPTYLVGEGRYNEAVVPLPNGRSIPVQMHGGGSQNNNVAVTVNMTNNGSQTQTEGPDASKMGQAIAAAVQRELVAQKAPGGLLNRYSTI